MSTSKYFNSVTAIIVALAVIFTSLLCYFSGNANAARAMSYSMKMPYESLFDQFEVMEIDIQISPENWQNMLENPLSEEYMQCDVTINGKSYTDAAIRTKGNTSLSQVASSDSDRYSFKIEFDHYDKNKSMDGLDKLVLNNLFCDATYVKEYIAYDIFHFIGVETPYYAFADISVNGENFGCYLALEAMEDSYLKRVYQGSGQLYKPESDRAGMGGGGMGNKAPEEFQQMGNRPEMPDTDEYSEFLQDMGWAEEENPSHNKSFRQDMTPPGAENTSTNRRSPEDTSEHETDIFSDNWRPPQEMVQPEAESSSENKGAPQEMTDPNSSSESPDTPENGIQMPDTDNMAEHSGFPGRENWPEMDSTGGGSDLMYIDNQIESYSDIFNNASFDPSDQEKRRVITALENLENGKELETYIDVDACLRYFAAQTFIVNMDSYYSNLKHNYYLYENNGQLTILPWDLNLAFGGFQSSDASSAVNNAIDTPMGGNLESSRPLFANLMEVPEYQELYHGYLNEIAEGYVGTGQLTTTLAKINAQISPYVEKDPTAFYSYSEYTKAIKTLETFIFLRAESVKKQLNGEIPSTSSDRNENTVLVDASSINLNDMGMQGGDGAGGKGSRDGNMFGGHHQRDFRP